MSIELSVSSKPSAKSLDEAKDLVSRWGKGNLPMVIAVALDKAFAGGWEASDSQRRLSGLLRRANP